MPLRIVIDGRHIRDFGIGTISAMRFGRSRGLTAKTISSSSSAQATWENSRTYPLTSAWFPIPRPITP